MNKTEWKNWLNEQSEKVKEEYLKTPERLIQDYRQEIELNKQYNGRQLLELLQNADDESFNTKQPHVLIRLDGNKLIVANNGSFFSRDGIKSLRFARISGKKHRLNIIGYKGLGFRSIINWAKEISIISGDLSVKYSEEIADNFLNELLTKEPSLKETIEQNRVAILSVPKWVDEPTFTERVYDTYIVLELKDDILDDFKKQIIELKPETLLFLNNLTQIDIDTPDRKEKIIADRNKDKIKIIVDEKNYSKKWFIRKTTDTIPNDLIKTIEDKKEYEIRIAFNEKLDDSINRLFCYFITKEKFPFPFLIHATLNLDDSRNYIVDDKINRFILDKIAAMLIEISIELNKNKINWDRLKFLAKRGEFGETIEEMGFYDSLINKIKDKKLIPTKQGYMISSKTYNYNFKEFNEILSNHEEFSNLAFFTDEDSIKGLLEKLGKNMYNKDELVSKLNKASSHLSLSERAKIIRSICDNNYNLFGWDYKSRPALFIDNHKKIIQSDVDLVLPPEGILDITFPNWVKIEFIDSALVGLLQKEFKASSLRDLKNKLSFFNVQEYSFSNFIRSIITSARERLKNEKNDDEIIKQLLMILYPIYKSKNVEQFPENIQVPIINNQGKIKNANSLYFGQEYRIGSMSYNLLKNVDSALFLADKESLGYKEIDEDELIDFFKWLGVSQYPRLILKELKDDYSEYRLYALKNLNYPLEFRGEVFKNYDELKTELHSYTKIKVYDVEFFDEILEKAEIEYIFAWFIKDSSIYDIIRTGRENNINSQLSLSMYRKIYYRTISGQEIPAYIYWKLITIPWVSTLTGKKTISSCCLENLNLSPLLEAPNYNQAHKIFRISGIDLKDINFMLTKLGIVEDIKNLSWNTIYSLLLDLPNKDQSGKIARHFYNQLVKEKSVDALDNEDSKYKEYMNRGKLFGECDGEKKYYQLEELFYLENITFPGSILKKKPILSIDRRVGAKKVETILGVKQLTEDMLNISIKSYLSHRLNEAFQNEFENFKPYAYFYRISKDNRKDNLRSLKNLKVILCSNIEIDSDIPDLNLGQHETIRIKNVVYLLVNNEVNQLNDLLTDYNFCYSISEIIMNSFKITDNETELRIKELFSNKIYRNNLLFKYHGDESKEQLERCKSLLGLILINKQEFWDILFELKGKKLEEDIQTDDQLLTEIKVKLGVIPEEIYEKIDYGQYNNPDNYNLFKKLFDFIKISVASFNNLSYKKIDFSEYFYSENKKLIIFYKKNFETSLFNKLQNDKLEWKGFKRIINEYNNLEFKILENDLIDIKDFFFQLIDNKFSITKEDLMNPPNKDIGELYNKNYENIIQDLKNKQFDNGEIINFLNTLSAEQDSLIYFGELGGLIKEFAQSHKPLDITKEPPKTDEEKLKETLTKIEKEIIDFPPPIEFAEPKRPSEDSEPRIKGKSKYFAGGTRISNDEKEEIGLIGEKILYERLKKDYGKEDVEWASSNAKKAGVNPEGNDHCGYDIYYKKGGKIKFIEVKSSKNEITAFNISRYEVDFGEKNKDDYEVWLVLNCMNKQSRKIINLGNVFKYKSKGESFNHNSNFLVQNDNFLISFLIEKD